MINISVIVPVYNVEKYLTRCLDSIFNQQFSGTFEVIAVDDCSTDNSLKLLYDYQCNEKRLTVIAHNRNKKLSIARSTGMKVAKGMYIMHVDSDDWILPNTFEKLFEKCNETNADVLVFNYRRENDQGQRYSNNEIKNNYVTNDKLKAQKYFFGATVNKIVKKDIIKNLICSEVELNSGEDLLYSTEILLKSKKICLLSDYYYVYFVNKDSITNTVKSLHFLKDNVVILSQLQKIFFEYNENIKISNNILNYFEKWIYLEIAKIHFWDNEKLYDCDKILRNLFNFSIFNKSRIRRLDFSLNSKFFCLIEVTKMFGIKMSISIIINCFKKNR